MFFMFYYFLGSNLLWYLSCVFVDDLCIEECWYFICECWLVVEEDDGKVECLFLVVSEKELMYF